jgi:hypothetical protein
MKSNCLFAGLLAFVLGASPFCLSQTQPVRPAPAQRDSSLNKAQALTPQEETHRFLQMPLDFEANRGQAPGEYKYVAHGPSYSLGISPSGLALALSRPRPDDGANSHHASGVPTIEKKDSSHLELRFEGSDGKSMVTGVGAEPGHSNYFIGNDPARWRTELPHFSRVQIADVYQGINLVLYGNQQQLEYDFAVAPGVDPRTIRLQAQGATAVTLDKDGNAVLTTTAGDVQLQHPVAYQQINGVRRPVESEFQIAEGKVLQFKLGDYDHSQSLVIDPVLIYGAEPGGSNGNEALGLAVDSTGAAYVTGLTCSADFPSTAGNFGILPTNAMALADCDSAFVFKIDPTGSTLVYSDFIGGTQVFSAGSNVAVDASGDAFVTGATGAPDFPLVSNIGPTSVQNCGIESAGENCPQAFILKLSPDGSKILWSSLLGGSQTSMAFVAKLNPVTGDLVVLGDTNSSNFLPAPTTLDTTFGGGSCANSNPCFNGFVLGLDPVAGTLRYGTFIGAVSDWAPGLAFDTGGNIYVSGSAKPPFAAAVGTVTHTYAPSSSATASGVTMWIAKFNLSANQLTPGYLTLIQGDGDTTASSIVLDSTGNLYFGGATAATHLPVTTGVYQSTNKETYGSSCLWPRLASTYLPNPCGTGLAGKLDTTGALSFLTYLGGSGQDIVEAINLDSSSNIWLGGVTSSSDFPLSANHYGNSFLGYFTPFLAEMSNSGAALPFASLIAAAAGQVSDIVIDSSNNIYIAGYANSALTTPGAYPANPQAYIPAFVQKWNPGIAPTISVSSTGMGFGTVALGATSPPQTVTVQNTGTVPMELSVQLEATYEGQTPSDFPESTTCGSSLAAGASCTVTAAFAPGPPSQLCVNTQGCDITSRSAYVVIQNNATAGTQQISLSGGTAVGPSFYVSPNPIVFPGQAPGTTSSPLYVSGGSTGDADFVASSAVLSGPNASDFQLQTTGVGFACINNPVQPGTYCNFTLTFTPPSNATGTRTASLTFTDNTGDSPQVIPISGTVASSNFLNISPLLLTSEFPVAFGTSTYSVLDLENPSTSASIQVTGVTITGTNKGDFSVTAVGCGSNNGALPITVAPGATCYLEVFFNPAAGASGLRTASLTVQTNPGSTGLPTVSLSDDVVTNSQPGLSLNEVPNPLNFGGLQVGETSNGESVLFSVGNYPPIPCGGGATLCGAPLIINSITPGLSDYTITGTTGCYPFPATISGYPCTYSVIFKPTQAGPRNTTIAIASNDPQGTVTIPVYGTGLTLPLAEIIGSALDFGNSAVGVASLPLTTTLQNTGQANLVFASVTASSNYTITANTCTGTLIPGAACTINVSFTPPSVGNFNGTLTITDNDGLAPQQVVTLAGTGATGPQLRIMPPTLDFGNQTIGSTSPVKTITFSNTGDSTVTFPANALRTSLLFVLQSTTCGTTLPAQSTCTASLQYKPTVYTGISDAGTLLVTDNVVGSPQQVYLQGTGVQTGTTLSTTTLKSSLNPSTSGQSVTFTATVTGPSGNTTVPSGTVNFFDGILMIGSGTLNSSGQATYTTSSLNAATHDITASYSGDATFLASNSAYVFQIVNPSTLPATTTLLVSSLNPSISGNSVTFTATVAGPSGNTTVPSGSVTFYDGTTSLGPGSLNGVAQAALATSALGAGTHSITAVYGGDTNFAGSTSAILSQVVNAPALLTSTTTVQSLLNPSTSGVSVTFTATVTGPSGNPAVPAGTVNFMDGTTLLGPGTLNGSGQATYATSALSVATHSITAVYLGNATFSGSTSSALMQVVNAIVLPTTTTALTSSLNPSGTGQSVTFTATVTGPIGITTIPTGTIIFKDGTTTLGTGNLNGTGVATYSTSALSSGNHSITAVYPGGTNFSGSTSAVVTQAVDTATFTLSASPGTVTLTAGSTGTTTISVTPAFGFNQQVSFACAGLPAYSTCSFSPTTVTPSGSTAATTTLTIATNVSAANVIPPAPFTRYSPALLALVLLGLGGIVRARRKWMAGLLGLVVVTALAIVLNGCGGSSGGGGGGGGGNKTPTGTSTVTVTATAGSISQNATFSLIVQ